MSYPHLVTIALAGVAALDATPVAQTLLSQPLITASLLGWLWGDWVTALEVGIVLQLLAASTLPVGSRTPEDYAVGGVVGVGLALGLAAHQPFTMVRESCALIGSLAGMIVAWGGVPLLKYQRRLNEGLARWCEDELRRGNENALRSAHLAAIVLSFSVGVGYAAVCLALGLWGLTNWVAHESLRLAAAWSLAQPLWIGLALAQLLQSFAQRRLARGAVFGMCLIATWLVLYVGSP